MQILRFGPGFRKRVAAAGSRGIADQAIWSDPRARITELALSRGAVMAPQASPDHGLFIVISGGGWVQVGDERVAMNHGEAVEWPAGVTHAAWTDGSEMRAILIELPDVAIEVSHARISTSGATTATVAKGALAGQHTRPDERDESEGEPW